MSPTDVNFNEQGLVPVIVQEFRTRDVLMLAYMNDEAIQRTLREGRAVYWSRSRREYWRKGDTSGNVQSLVSLTADCDGDALLMLVEQTGPACHTGTMSCFDAQRRVLE